MKPQNRWRREAKSWLRSFALERLRLRLEKLLLRIGVGQPLFFLSVVGSLAGGGDLGAVDLIYVPEPSSLTLALLSLSTLVCWRRRKREAQLSRL